MEWLGVQTSVWLVMPWSGLSWRVGHQALLLSRPLILHVTGHSYPVVPSSVGPSCQLLDFSRDMNSRTPASPWPSGKECAGNAGATGDLGSIPSSDRSPGGGNNNPVQYSCLENPHGQCSLVDDSPWGRQEPDTTEVTWHGTHSMSGVVGGVCCRFRHQLAVWWEGGFCCKTEKGLQDGVLEGGRGRSWCCSLASCAGMGTQKLPHSDLRKPVSFTYLRFLLPHNLAMMPTQLYS